MFLASLLAAVLTLCSRTNSQTANPCFSPCAADATSSYCSDSATALDYMTTCVRSACSSLGFVFVEQSAAKTAYFAACSANAGAAETSQGPTAAAITSAVLISTSEGSSAAKTSVGAELTWGLSSGGGSDVVSTDGAESSNLQSSSGTSVGASLLDSTQSAFTFVTGYYGSSLSDSDFRSRSSTSIDDDVTQPTPNSSSGRDTDTESKKSDDIALGVGIGIGIPTVLLGGAAVYYARL